MPARPVVPLIEGRTNRPALIAVVFLAAAAGFWALGPPPIPELPTLAPAAAPTPPQGGGGYSDGRPEPELAPLARAPRVRPGAAVDGAVQMLVLGDEQAVQWAPHARRVLEERLARLPSGPFVGLSVELDLRAEPGWTSEHVLHALQHRGADAQVPELIVVAIGWHDGAPPGAPLPEALRRVEATGTWLDELAAQSVVGLEPEQARFFLRGREPQVTPTRHLELLDSLGLEAATIGAALMYVEQPVRHTVGERRILASTAMRPQPWINTVFGLESHPEPAALFAAAEGTELSEAGAAMLGTYIGVGLVQTLAD